MLAAAESDQAASQIDKVIVDLKILKAVDTRKIYVSATVWTAGCGDVVSDSLRVNSNNIESLVLSNRQWKAWLSDIDAKCVDS
jgi:hypothetical protein